MFLEMKCILWVHLVILLGCYLFKMCSYEKKLLSARFPTWTSRVIYLDNFYLNVSKWIQFLEVVDISNPRGFLKTNESSPAKAAHPDLKQHDGSLIWEALLSE